VTEVNCDWNTSSYRKDERWTVTGIPPPTERMKGDCGWNTSSYRKGERWTVTGIPPPTEMVKGGLWLE
jgi:hypothetical protein